MALPVSFRWPPEFIAAVDKARGDVPRSVFVKRALEAALGSAAKPASPSPPVIAGLTPSATEIRLPCIPGCLGGDNHKVKCPNHKRNR